MLGWTNFHFLNDGNIWMLLAICQWNKFSSPSISAFVYCFCHKRCLPAPFRLTVKACPVAFGFNIGFGLSVCNNKPFFKAKNECK